MMPAGRVILVAPRGSVSRMPLERALRSDERLELVRVRTQLEALGELSRSLMDPMPAVVVVSEIDADDSNGHGLHGLAVGIRRVNPDAKLVRVGGESDESDGVLAVSLEEAAARIGGLMERSDHDKPDRPRRGDATPDAPESQPQNAFERGSDHVSEHVSDHEAGQQPGPNGESNGVSPRLPHEDFESNGSASGGGWTWTEPEQVGSAAESDGVANPEATPEATPDAAPDGDSLADALAGPSVGDVDLVAILLRGDDVRSTATRLARARLGVPASLDAGPDAPEGSSAVAWRGRSFGWLIAPEAAEADRRAVAGWLAGWLQLASQHAELRHAAFIDPLTGAYNRRFFDRFLPSAIEQARAARTHVTLLVFDIDEFKKYNDQHGHGAGDEILTEVVRLLRSVIRPTDRVCRIGGDEFAVIFSDPPRDATSRPPESVFEISRRFQQQVIDHRFPKLGSDAPGALTVSGGLATFPWDASTDKGLLERADALAMQSKRLGKNAIALGPGAELVCRKDRGR